MKNTIQGLKTLNFIFYPFFGPIGATGSLKDLRAPGTLKRVYILTKNRVVALCKKRKQKQKEKIG